jgi:hypothetical protein
MAGSMYASWIHGHSVLLERFESPQIVDKATIETHFGNYHGDIIDLMNSAAVACLRIGWAARFVVFDSGKEDEPKSGGFWVHYAIPTPVVLNLDEDLSAGHRAIAKCVLLNYESQDINQITSTAVHVWDGNRQIAAFNAFPASQQGHNGGISGSCRISQPNCGTPDIGNKLWRGVIQRPQPVFFGIGVSIHIQANNAKDNYLEIRGVGVEFDTSG